MPQPQPDRPLAATRAEPQKGLIWLASYPKSGNTWTRTFLHNLLGVMRGEAGAGWDINQLNEFSTAAQGIRLFEEIIGKPWTECSKDEIAKCRAEVQARVYERSDGLAFVKTHNALMADRGHPTVNLSITSGAVYVVRNPLDVAISYAHHLSAPIDRAIQIMGRVAYETGGSERQSYELMGSWSEHVVSWSARPHRAIHVMRYEDMLAKPVETFGALARFLLLLPSKEELGRAIAMSSFEALRGQEDEKGFREKPEKAERFFRVGKAEQWREQLSQAQVKRILRDHGKVMERFGYVPAGMEAIAGGRAGYRPPKAATTGA